MEKLDFKTADKAFYSGKAGRFDRVDVAEMAFLMMDGQGDPNRVPAYAAAVQALYGLSYGLKFHAKAVLGRDHAVGPLEGLWWAEDMADFTSGHREGWRWTMMIRQPDWMTGAMLEDVRQAKAIDAPVRLARWAEGPAMQTLYLGAYADEGPTIEGLHQAIAAAGLRLSSKHHEIYLGDPRKTPPEKLKTLLRQPVAA